jgi:hypothetical protein
LYTAPPTQSKIILSAQSSLVAESSYSWAVVYTERALARVLNSNYICHRNALFTLLCVLSNIFVVLVYLCSMLKCVSGCRV